MGGRRYSPDARDKLYPMRAVTRRKIPRELPVIWQIGPTIDQGLTPECVAYSCANWLSCTPIQTIVDTPAYEDNLYHEAQLVDEWPGTDYDGTSVRAGFQVLQTQGHLKNYVWAESEQDIFDFVATTGPVVMGTNWYDGMFDPDSDGFLRPTGDIAGGHAWLIYGIVNDYYLMQNSWGPWGIANSGTAKIRRTDLARLLAEDGEAGAGVEVPITPEPPPPDPDNPPAPPPPEPDKPGGWCALLLFFLLASIPAAVYAAIRVFK
jgi:hypothetical protein